MGMPKFLTSDVLSAENMKQIHGFKLSNRTKTAPFFPLCDMYIS